MQKVYLLLRNNRQQGPYSLDELLQQKLQPLDLVWVEGKSAGWRYPGEINELKQRVDLPIPDQLVSNNNLVSGGNETAESTKRSETSINICNKKIYVCMPAGSKEQKLPEKMAENRLEEKAEELYRRVQAFAAATPVTVEDPVLDTKYSRSLDDIKNEYTQWLSERKSGSKIHKPKYLRGIMVGILLLLLFTVAWYILPQKKAVSGTDEKTASTLVPDSEIADEEDYHIRVHDKKFAGTKHNNAVSSEAQEKPVPTITKTPRKSRTVPAPKKVAKPEIKAQVRRKPESVSSSLPSLVRISGTHYTGRKKGVNAFELTVTNNSEEFIRFVAVDVYYVKSDGKVVTKKTLYFNNLAPHQHLTLMAPSNKKADDIRYSLGLLSSENGGIYYAKNQ